ncbi:hypothetical protein ABW20_dc0109734 [Dactylellina cionopaga]|nr:hypothetical protein ABW20_dc0109734 [Dactylellina cionopaga]
MASRIVPLREDAKVKDLSYLTRLNPETFTNENLTATVLAYRVAEVAKKDHNLSIPTEILYGLFATNINQKFLSQDSLSAGQSDLSLETSPQTLLYQLGLIDSGTITNAIKEAVGAKLISNSIDVGMIPGIWESLEGLGNNWIIRQPTVEDRLWTAIGKFLSSGAEEAVRKVLDGGNIEGDIIGLLYQLIQAFATNNTAAQAILMTVQTPGSNTLQSVISDTKEQRTSLSSDKIVERLSDTHGGELLAKMDRSTLKATVRVISVDILGGKDLSSEEQREEERAIEQLKQASEKDFPTVSFAARLRQHIEDTSSQPRIQTDIAKNKATKANYKVILGHQSLSIDANSVADFLDLNPDFDLLTGKLKLSTFAKTQQDTNMIKGVAMVQRVFKLAPTFDKSLALLNAGIHSAAEISRMARNHFVKKMGSEDSPFTLAEATDVFQRASDVHLATALLAGDLQGASNALLPAGISEPLPPEKLDSVSKDFPDLSTLFQFGDICACADCMTVYSPSAYFVDVLEFLRFRGVIDAGSGQNNGAMARDVLFKRRPDLGDLELTCNNTNTTLPYIDLVIELLEDLVAPDGLSPGSFSGTPVKGKIQPDLLSFLRDGLKLPFSENAIVSDLLPNGTWTVRDDTMLVSLNSSTGSVRVLRQTYSDAQTLGASPTYVNTVAYDRLADSAYLPTLPFNLALEECRGYLKQLGVPRFTLMAQILNKPDQSKIALEKLKLSSKDGSLITTPDVNNQDKYWNTGYPTKPTEFLQNVANFVNTAKIEYTDLQAMLDATWWLNPPQQPPPNLAAKRIGILYIRHEDSSCTLANKTIVEIDNQSLDRFHRFLRLWNALSQYSATEWTISNIDRAIAAEKLGKGLIDPTFITKAVLTSDVSKALNKTTPTSVNDIIDLYTTLQLVVAGDDKSPNSTITYSSLFLDAIAHGPISPAFQIESIAINVSAKVADYVDYISRCLETPTSDIQIVIGSLSSQPENEILSVPTLSKIYAVISLSKRLQLSVTDYYLLSKLSNNDPLSDLAQVDPFVQTLQKIQGIGLAISDIEYLTQQPPDPPSTRYITDGEIALTLSSIQSQYVPIQAANISPFNDKLTLIENTTAAFTVVSRVPGITQTDLDQFRQMFEGDMSANDGKALLDTKLTPTIGATAAGKIIDAQNNLSLDPSNAVLQMELVEVFSDVLSKYFAFVQRQDAVVAIFSTEFGLSTDLTKVLLASISLLQTLFDETLASKPISQPNFEQQYKAVKLTSKLAFILPLFSLANNQISWLLKNSAALNWADLKQLPTNSTDPPIAWDQWISLLDYVIISKSAKFTDVKNAADKNTPFTLFGLLEVTMNSASTIEDFVTYFSALTSYNPDDISALVSNFGYSLQDFKTITVLQRLDSAATALRKANMPTSQVVSICSADTPTSDDVINARNALKKRYTANSDWLDVLKTIQDPLRLRKRDSLVNFLLEYSKPSISSSTEISEILLIDVDMGTETQTSRIIQAHQSIQQFVQRLQMGLESVRIIADDQAWDHWQELSQYRLWEANKKVFLYPENWIDPELRDNKSELYTGIEDDLKQQPLTDTSVEQSVSGYLQKLDDIAYLEVGCCFYDTPSKNFHVIGRSKGGNPKVYYHRTLQLETIWSPWETLKGVEIPGNHVHAFLRNGRFNLIWPVFSYEQNPDQVNTPPQYPDPANMKGTSPDPLEKRLLVQLGVTEKNPDTGKWSPSVVTEGAVYWPPDGRYIPAAQFPPDIEESISLHYWDFRGNLGQTIVVSYNIVYAEDRENPVGAVIGIFNITGCKGYPEPFTGPSQGQERGSVFWYLPIPVFRNTKFVEERWSKDPSLSTVFKTDLAIKNLVMNTEFNSILGTELGRFGVTYPAQPTIVDQLLILLQIYANSTSQRRLHIPQGTFLPYFVTDSSTRGYAITPGYKSANAEDKNFRTASATIDFINRALSLALKYIDIYFHEANKNIDEVRKRINDDEEYKTLKTELLDVYIDATNPQTLKFRATEANFTSFYHPLVCFLRSQLYSGGLPGLLARTTQLQTTTFDFNATYIPTNYVRQPYPLEELDFSTNGPYASYNWELFFHLPFEIATKLSADQQFDKAQTWFQYIFNPQGVAMDDPGTPIEPQRKYWQTKPFFRTQINDYLEQRIDSILGAIADDPQGLSLANDIKTQVQLWRSNPYSPHVIARLRPVAYQVCTVMKYIQNLMDWGDSLFRQLTRETITQASTLYMIVSKLLGSKPKVVKPAVAIPPRTYNELGTSIDIVGNALLKLENLIPDISTLPHEGKELPQPPYPPLSSLYFGIPPNDQMLQLWDLVADRLFKIRHSQDINGNFISLALTSPPIDPGALVRAVASGVPLSGIISGLNSPLPHYRFRYVLERAQVMTQHVMDFGNQLLAALEKRDAEALSRLRATSEVTVLTAVRDVKQAAIDQNLLALDVITAARVSAVDRQSYYKGLLLFPISLIEILSLLQNYAAMNLDDDMESGHKFAGVMNLIPTFSVGLQGVGGSPQASISFGGNNFAASSSSFMAAKAANRSFIATSALVLSTLAAYQRRTAEWTFQAQQATDDIAHIDAQTKAATATGKMLTADLTAHDVTISESNKALAYLQSKYTNTELYQWAVSRISGVYFQAYQVAFDMAKKAEQCMAFELGDFSSAPIVQYGYWDTLHNGLLAGMDLQLSLDRLESAYTSKNMRELELSKPVSLAQLDPIALLNLRTTGSCIFSIPEAWFDLDFPGHYFRRTKYISISIPCVVGPYTSVSATLRLFSSRYRAKTTGATVADYPEKPGGDTRFVYNVVPPPVITAASTAVNDAGIFELRLNGDDPRYLPFEHAGVIGTYELTLPPTQQFSYASIADAILNISYTARDGGSALRGAATPVPTSGVAAVTLGTSFPVDWNALKADLGEVVIMVEDESVALSKASDGLFWKGEIPAKKVLFGKSVKIGWNNPDDRIKVDEITFIVDFKIKAPTDS